MIQETDRVYPPPSQIPQAAGAQAEGLVLTLNARQSCWVAAQVDGQTVILLDGNPKAVRIEKQGDKFTSKDLWTDRESRVEFNTPILKDNLLFGLTGGRIPCPAAITVLLLCLQLKELALGFTLVLCFSIGLAITLVAVGIAAALSVRHAKPPK